MTIVKVTAAGVAQPGSNPRSRLQTPAPFPGLWVPRACPHVAPHRLVSSLKATRMPCPPLGHRILVPELPSPHFQGEPHTRLPRPWQSGAGHKPALLAPDWGAALGRLGEGSLQVGLSLGGAQSWARSGGEPGPGDSGPPPCRIRGWSPGLKAEAPGFKPLLLTFLCPVFSKVEQ